MAFGKGTKQDLLKALAEHFVTNNDFYWDKINHENLLKAWKIYRKNKNFEGEDGYNPSFNREIVKEFGTEYAYDKDIIIFWEVVAETFDDWLGN